MKCWVYETSEIFKSVKDAESNIMGWIQAGHFTEMCILRYSDDTVVKTIGTDSVKANEISNYKLVKV